MVDTAVGRVALFSIHPRYAHAILDGSKQVEFRRQGLPEDVTHVVIYATSPVQQVVGMFEVGGINKMMPTRAWRLYSRVGGIEKSAFERYYSKYDYAFVIRVRNPQDFSVTVPRAYDLDDTAHRSRTCICVTNCAPDRRWWAVSERARRPSDRRRSRRGLEGGGSGWSVVTSTATALGSDWCARAVPKCRMRPNG